MVPTHSSWNDGASSDIPRLPHNAVLESACHKALSGHFPQWSALRLISHLPFPTPQGQHHALDKTPNEQKNDKTNAFS